ncbi:MAG: exosortase C-terminal domain/associated protein EpsI [Acidobacteriota bacterium]
MSFRPYWAVIVLLSMTLVVLRVRGDQDHVPPSLPLSNMPILIGAYRGIDIAIPDESLAVLGRGDFLNRAYIPTNPAHAGDDAAIVGLFIGYFPTQRTGQSIHSPQHCLPGAGWTFTSSGTVDVPKPGAPPDRVGDYTITNGTQKAEVLYWYQSQGRAIANDYVAKLDTLANSIRYGRTDAALVRITTTYHDGETTEQVRQRALEFAEKLNPLLPAYIPN